MIKRFSSQEIFIIIAALSVLLFMYVTIIISAPINELTEIKEQADSVLELGEVSSGSNFVMVNMLTEDNYE